MSDREPICDHLGEFAGRVANHEEPGPLPLNEPHASTYVCGRNECVADAVDWVAEMTGQPGAFSPFPVGHNAATSRKRA